MDNFDKLYDMFEDFSYKKWTKNVDGYKDFPITLRSKYKYLYNNIQFLKILCDKTHIIETTSFYPPFPNYELFIAKEEESKQFVGSLNYFPYFVLGFKPKILIKNETKYITSYQTFREFLLDTEDEKDLIIRLQKIILGFL